jgi:hypothetical protein
MSKNRGKSKLSNNVLFNATKHVFHCEKLLGTLFYGLRIMNEYNNPSFATMFQRALLNTCITTYFERRIVVLIHCYMRNRMHSPNIKIYIQLYSDA